MEFDWRNDLPEPIKFHVTFRIQNSRHYERGLLGIFKTNLGSGL